MSSGSGASQWRGFEGSAGGDRAGWQLLQAGFEAGLARAVLEGEPGRLDALQMLGHALTRLGRHEEALGVDRQVVRLAPADPVAHYNLACSLSNGGAVDEAFGALERAVALGYRDFGFLCEDPDLENVRRDGRFAGFLERVRGLKQGKGP